MVRWQKTNALNLMLDPSNHTRWETQMKVAQSGLRVGSVGLSVVAKKRMSECGAQEIFCNHCNDERETLSVAQSPNRKDYQTEQKKKKADDIGPTSHFEQLCGDCNVFEKKWINVHEV